MSPYKFPYSQSLQRLLRGVGGGICSRSIIQRISSRVATTTSDGRYRPHSVPDISLEFQNVRIVIEMIDPGWELFQIWFLFKHGGSHLGSLWH
jgi:hypothetical protein